MKFSASRTYKVITIVQLKYFTGYLCQSLRGVHSIKESANVL